MSASFEEENTSDAGIILPKRALLVRICLCLAFLTLAVYLRTIQFDFVNFDDNANVYENGLVASGLTLHGFINAFVHGSLANWDPLTTLSHMVDCQVFGLWAGGHHLTNVLLHTATVVLLFLVLQSMTGRLWPSALVAAIFAVHPLHVESVAWVSERKDVLSGLFFVLTLGAYLRYVRRPGKGSYALVLLGLALGLMSKSMLVTMPAILLVLDWWPLKRTDGWKKLIVEKVPVAALSLAATVMAFWAQEQAHAVEALDKAPLGLRLENVLVSYVTYLWQTIWPANLAAYYPYPVAGLPLEKVAIAALVLAGITALVIWQRKERPYLLAGWLWYAMMLVPVIGLVKLGNQAYADRYMYLPQIGLSIGVIWWLAGVGEKLASIHYIRWAAATVSIFLLASLAYTQSLYWKNTEALWTRTIAVTDRNPLAHYDFGTWLLQHNELDKAQHEFETAVQQRPDYASALNNLGLVLFYKNKPDEAIPNLIRALQLDPSQYTALNNLGGCFIMKGRDADAEPQFRQALRLKPDFDDAHFNLANLLARRGETNEAIQHYQAAVAGNPRDYGALNNLGSILLKGGRTKEAVPSLRKALALNSAKTEARDNLNQAVWNLATAPQSSLRDGPLALEIARQLNELTKGQDPAFLATLAAAEAENGHFDQASVAVSKAQAIALREGDKANAALLGEQLHLYEQKLPFRDTNLPVPIVKWSN